MIKAVRWVGRILGTLVALFMVASFLGDRAVWPLMLNEIIALAGFGMATLGFIAGWKWDLVAGLLILIGLTAHFLVIPASVSNPLI